MHLFNLFFTFHHLSYFQSFYLIQWYFLWKTWFSMLCIHTFTTNSPSVLPTFVVVIAFFCYPFFNIRTWNFFSIFESWEYFWVGIRDLFFFVINWHIFISTFSLIFIIHLFYFQIFCVIFQITVSNPCHPPLPYWFIAVHLKN